MREREGEMGEKERERDLLSCSWWLHYHSIMQDEAQVCSVQAACKERDDCNYNIPAAASCMLSTSLQGLATLLLGC